MTQSHSNQGVACQHDHPVDSGAIEQYANEEFVVVKTNAIGNPRTVMVHLENATVALGAMVGTVRFRFVAPVADSSSTFFLFLNVLVFGGC